jgi:DNA-binding NtrC family response regulator
VDNHHFKVLIIDDERTIADTFAQIFSGSGFETRSAYSAEQVLEIVVEWSPDLAIIDVLLPQMNGVDLAIVLTTQCPACRLLLFSGQAVTDDLVAEAATKGYNFDILAKPVHPTEILEVAQKLLSVDRTNKEASGT